MAALEKRRVLIADDEPSMRTTLADILVDHGLEVSTAEDGLSAVQMCQQQAYDVVLMDVRMPGINGVEAFRRIRQTLQDVRIILMSAYGDEDTKHELLREGAIAFLDKPLNLETVDFVGLYRQMVAQRMEEAMAEMKALSGKLFDHEILEIFIGKFSEENVDG